MIFFHRKLPKRDTSNIVYFHLRSKHFAEKGKNKIVSLYPFQSNKVMVAFFYGDDFERQRIRSILNNFGSMFFNWFNLYIFAGAAVLCAIRRILKLRRDGFISSVIDVLTTYIGGGNVHINRHMLEKWFYGTVFVTSIFLNAIGLQSSLFSSFVDFELKIDTFEKLAKINPPICLSPSLEGNFDIVTEVLR